MNHIPKSIQNINETLTDFFEKHSSVTDSVFRKKYLKTDFESYGINVPLIRKEIKFIVKKNNIDLENIFELSKLWWSKKIVEFRLAAIFILLTQINNIDKSRFEFIENMIFTSTGWWEVDVLAIEVIGGVIENYPTILLQLPLWIDSPNFWIRRAALICQIKQFRKGKGDIVLHTNLIVNQLNMTNKWEKIERFFIEKAIAWSLRELSKSKPIEVINILNLEVITPSKFVIKEATSKLPESYLHLLKYRS